jgi:hypothetical protein
MTMNRTLLFAAACALALGAACNDYNPDDNSGNMRSRPRDSGIAVHASTPQEFVRATSYVGMRYASLPSGFAYQAGSVVARGAGSARYALSQVRTPRGTMLWLETLEGRERVVRAELRVPPLASDERLLIGSCDRDGRLDPKIVAIVVGDSTTVRFVNVRQAWRADADASRFDLLPVAGIVCEEPTS